MPENQKRILEMLRDKKISVEEAERLLSLTGMGEKSETPPGEPEKKRSFKYLRVVVTPDPEGHPGEKTERVNVRVPINLIRAGMKLGVLIPPLAADEVNNALKEEGINFDMRNLKPDDVEELMQALGDLEVDIDGKHGEKVRVFVE